ncbi:MAG TPA: GGDEF domain-containing protein [Allosphingosinicella sp.]
MNGRVEDTALQARPANAAPRSWRLPLLAVILVMMLIATEVGGFLFTSYHQRALIELRNDTREMRILQQALVDRKESAEDYLLTRDPSALRGFHTAADLLGGMGTSALPRLDAATGQGRTAPSRTLAELDAIWNRAVSLAERGQPSDAQQLLAQGEARTLVTDLRGAIAAYLDDRNVTGDVFERRIELGGALVLVLQLLGGCITIAFLAFAFRSHAREAERRRDAVEEAVLARREVEILFDMADTLQSAAGYDDAQAVLRATAGRLLPQLSGRLYVFNNSRDRLDLIAQWGEEEKLLAPISPPSCWALKRGKAHFNEKADGALRCDHFEGERDTLEMPMMARGEVYGLLSFSSRGGDACVQLKASTKIISALADGMSLALSNLSLREKLRNQALRDPLTGLYNRRYMEDMLDRFVRLAVRKESSLAVVMIDLDHFKRLNDQHGHLLGDAVLRAVAGTIMESLRETDVACRYGGEELIVLLPDCDMDAATAKAEEIRVRIEELSGAHGVEISASLGVAAIPSAASTVQELVKAADVALYEAKSAGRNCVRRAADNSRPLPTLVAAE